MDTDLKCNRLTCRRHLNDKAVVTTCSHIFCVECANELFNSSRLCPACETSLTEPDDVVVCSLHPTNDYKTSVLSGLSPSTILEICNRAISFWQYQIHQENTFQQAVVRNVNDKNAQLQKQLDSVIREANGELNLFRKKTAELERDLELERRKVRELQESARERDKEYQKLKDQHDKIRRKALLGPAPGHDIVHGLGPAVHGDQFRPRATNRDVGGAVNLEAVVGGMEANGIQRTPLVNRTSGNNFANVNNNGWSQINQMSMRHRSYPPGQNGGDHSFRSYNASDRSASANEVESLLTHGQHQPSRGVTMATQAGWNSGPALQSNKTVQRAFAQSATKRSGQFRPHVGTR